MSDTPIYCHDADGNGYVYRMVASRLERRPSYGRYYSEVQGVEFLKMTPKELRHVADVLERKIHAEAVDVNRRDATPDEVAASRARMVEKHRASLERLAPAPAQETERGR